MTDTNRISVNAFEKAVQRSYTKEKLVAWNGIKISVRNTLSLKDVLSFVSDVVHSCFSDDDGSYMPELKDFAQRVCVVKFYTNIALPSNTELKYDFLYGSDICNVILNNINAEQYSEIIRAIDSKIDSLVQTSIQASAKKINEICSSFENIQTSLQEVFSGISGDDVKKIVEAVSQNGIGLNEEKLVEAYISHSPQTAKES